MYFIETVKATHRFRILVLGAFRAFRAQNSEITPANTVGVEGFCKAIDSLQEVDGITGLLYLLSAVQFVAAERQNIAGTTMKTKARDTPTRNATRPHDYKL